MRDLKPSKVRSGPCAGHVCTGTRILKLIPLALVAASSLRQHATRAQCATIKFGHVSCIDDDSQALCNTYGVECPSAPSHCGFNACCVPVRAWLATCAASRALSAHVCAHGAFMCPRICMHSARRPSLGERVDISGRARFLARKRPAAVRDERAQLSSHRPTA